MQIGRRQIEANILLFVASAPAAPRLQFQVFSL